MKAVVECVPASLRTTTRIEPVTAAPSEAPPATASSNRFSVDDAETDMSPPAETCAVLPIHAPTSLSMTSTMIETPTAALPSLRASAPATLMRCVVSVALTSIVWADVPSGPLWLICALSAIQACVVIEKTSTMTEPVTAASPPPAPPRDRDRRDGRKRDLRDLRVGDDRVDRRGRLDRERLRRVDDRAGVDERLGLDGREDVDHERAADRGAARRERRRRSRGSGARCSGSPRRRRRRSRSTCAPAPIDAVVWKVSTWMPTDAAMLASDLPPAAAMPQTMKSSSLPDGVTASTVTPPPVTCAPAPMDAVFVMSSTLRPTPAPMRDVALEVAR